MKNIKRMKNKEHKIYKKSNKIKYEFNDRQHQGATETKMLVLEGYCRTSRCGVM